MPCLGKRTQNIQYAQHDKSNYSPRLRYLSRLLSREFSPDSAGDVLNGTKKSE